MTNTVTETSVHEEATMCTKKEKLGHALGVLGHDSAYTLWATWATPFMTDILALPAAFLGALLAGARIFDAFTDISMGVIADRTRSKWGRFRPWVLRAGPLFCLLMALSFLKPSFLGTTGLCVFAGLLYVLTGSIAFTAVDIPFWSLPAAMTSNPKERDGTEGETCNIKMTEKVKNITFRIDLPPICRYRFVEKELRFLQSGTTSYGMKQHQKRMRSFLMCSRMKISSFMTWTYR